MKRPAKNVHGFLWGQPHSQWEKKDTTNPLCHTKAERLSFLNKEEGIVVIVVLFLVVVLGALGIAAGNLSGNQGTSAGMMLTANGATYTALAGTRYGAQQIKDTGATIVPAGTFQMPGAASLPANASSFTLSGSGVYPTLTIRSRIQAGASVMRELDLNATFP